MTRPNVKKLQERLRSIGFLVQVDGHYGPQTAREVRRFREGFVGPNLRTKPLPQEGRVRYGDRTWRAIRWSSKHGGKVSPSFAWREFACKDPRNHEIRIVRGHLLRLERLRVIVGKPIPIVSGYRTPYWNRQQGGAEFSQHQYGAASDIPEGLGVSIVDATLAGFTGIGYDEDNRYVEHVDSRDLGENNTTGSQPGHPTTWRYS